MLDKTLTRLAPWRVFLLVALAGMILGGSFTSVTSAQASSPPTELQTEAAEPTPGGFKLNGKLNPDGLPTTYYFNYNTGAECEEIEGCAQETAVVGPLTGNTQQEVPPIELTGLAPGQTYRYSLVAKNADGTVRGGELTFVTPAELPPSEVVTEPAEQTANGFRLKGDLNPGGLPTTYYFRYNTGFECEEIEGCARETVVVGPLTGDTQQEVPPIEVTGLAPGQIYRYSLPSPRTPTGPCAGACSPLPLRLKTTTAQLDRAPHRIPNPNRPCRWSHRWWLGRALRSVSRSRRSGPGH